MYYQVITMNPELAGVSYRAAGASHCPSLPILHPLSVTLYAAYRIYWKPSNIIFIAISITLFAAKVSFSSPPLQPPRESLQKGTSCRWPQKTGLTPSWQSHRTCRCVACHPVLQAASHSSPPLRNAVNSCRCPFNYLTRTHPHTITPSF